MREQTALLAGEYIVGQYTVDILRETNTGIWQPSLMQLHASVTNYRLLLQPFRKKYAPASLPARYIAHTAIIQKENRHCLRLRFTTGQSLYLLLSTGKLDHLYDDLQVMKTPVPDVTFDAPVNRRAIERIIQFFTSVPVLA